MAIGKATFLLSDSTLLGERPIQIHMQIMQQFWPVLASGFADPATHLLEVTSNHSANFRLSGCLFRLFFCVRCALESNQETQGKNTTQEIKMFLLLDQLYFVLAWEQMCCSSAVLFMEKQIPAC